MPAPAPDITPKSLAPYFVIVGLIHAAAVATRFDVLAAKLPPGAPLAIMVAQFPLLILTGYFESRLAYDIQRSNLPAWMQIESRAVKVAITFGFMYLVVVAAQTWDVSIGPIDPTPPLTFPTAQRALWFAMFTLGFAMIFFMAAAAVFVPVLRAIAYPLRFLPTIVAALTALVVGGGLGVVVLAAISSTKIGDFIAGIKASIQVRPALFVGLTLAATLGPLLIGAILERRKPE